MFGNSKITFLHGFIILCMKKSKPQSWVQQRKLEIGARAMVFYPTFPCTIRMEENEGRRRTGSGGQFA
jgi:hypothetical protein